ncbi:MAG: hypothetical protein GY778_13400 [bacterium]|nr:hypothetical protein [bacterium]
MVAGALGIARSKSAAVLVRGLVLANVPPDEISDCVGAPDEIVRMYEKVFWNVRPKLRAAGYIAICIRAFSDSVNDAVCLRLAFLYGRDVLLEVAGVQQMKASTVQLLDDVVAADVRRRALAAANCPVTPANAHRVMRAYLKLRNTERKERVAETRQARQRAKLELAKQKLEARRRDLEEKAVLLAEREKAVSERERRCERLIAEARGLQRDATARPIAASRLAALGQPRKPPAGESRVA